MVSPTWLQPPADLLEESTYGDPLAVKYFEWLGQELQKRPKMNLRGESMESFFAECLSIVSHVSTGIFRCLEQTTNQPTKQPSKQPSNQHVMSNLRMAGDQPFRPDGPRVQRGHLGGDREQASVWGDACAVWLGALRFMKPAGKDRTVL